MRAQVDLSHAVLMETERLGRTAQFAFASPRPAGTVVTATIRGLEAGRLVA